MPMPAPMAPPIAAPFSSESRFCAEAWSCDKTSDASSAPATVKRLVWLIMLINRLDALFIPVHQYCRHDAPHPVRYHCIEVGKGGFVSNAAISTPLSLDGSTIDTDGHRRRTLCGG